MTALPCICIFVSITTDMDLNIEVFQHRGVCYIMFYLQYYEVLIVYIFVPTGVGVDLEEVWSIKKNVTVTKQGALDSDGLSLNVGKGYYSRYGHLKGE